MATWTGTGQPALMTRSSSADLSSIQGLDHAIVALPYQFGFWPTDSLVLICLRMIDAGEQRGAVRGSVVFTARVDLPLDGGTAELKAALAPALRRPNGDTVILVAFEDSPDFAHSAQGSQRALASVASSVREAGLEVLALARVRGERWQAVDVPGRNDVWIPLPATSDVPIIADYVFAGRVPAADRRDIESVLRPTHPNLTKQVKAVIDGQTSVPSSAQTVCSVATVLSQILSSDPTADVISAVDPVELAHCALGLHDVHLRDALLDRLCPGLTGAHAITTERARALQDLLPTTPSVASVECRRLAALGSHVPQLWSSPMFATAGYLAWYCGDGALALITTQAALRADPDCSLARLVDHALWQAMPPPRAA